ncbi:MAG: twin-arginine translocase subunit TatC [Rikenellaceae bacterium]
MTFWDHIEELRWRVVRIVIVWVLLAIGYFIAMPYLFDSVILAPCNNDFVLYEFLRHLSAEWSLQSEIIDNDFQVTLVNINLAAPLLIHLSTAFALSVVTAAPYLFYEVWLFIKPGLYAAERRSVRTAFIFGSVMFYIGVFVGYILIYPLALRFLSGYQLSTTIENTISLNSYIENFTMLVLSMGLAFEIPLILWLLSLMGLITRDLLRRYRRHAIVAIVVIAAVITPTSDPFTLTVVALPLYILYEFSYLILRK